ncbi:killer cell lectin-like receptor subfamily E member 1 [Ornithorhynchus anatinus]|uniref:killer cell lectin-like receptor subfamily E member 1 n=1 Tax=Ornithorhynchus anatinus TaxID=9258 RepID=UPI0019D47534|nr:killer cell lectin-like receptor subfamily E member 1 [Ornithorhynchus anatinus]
MTNSLNGYLDIRTDSPFPLWRLTASDSGCLHAVLVSLWRLQAKYTSTSLWRLITVILGSFCLVLLATTCVLTTQVLQGASSNITTNQTGHHCSPCPENWILCRNNATSFLKKKECGMKVSYLSIS